MKLKNIFFFIQIIVLSLSLVSAATVYEINQSVPDDSDYKKVEFTGAQKLLNHYFKYTVSSIPSSRIGAFRIEFDQFNQLSYKMNKVFCTFVDSSASDDQLIQEVGLIDDITSSCLGSFTEDGIYDGLIKYPETKKKLAIYMVAKGHIDFTARLYLRINEKTLSANEQKIIEDSSYSMIPFTITISNFRQYASKILFYSYTRELQMYYLEEESPYPQRIFFGNILSVYTNPNMVRQKYRNANTMVLLTRRFDQEEMVGEPFQFQVKFFASDYLLDYYMGSNLEGRTKNTPLSINMTECDNPYYVIVNYNTPEKEISLYIDEIYGKIKSLSVAPTLSSSTWDEMIVNDMQHIEASTRKYVLPKNSPTHMDVFKVECDVPLLLNFYYRDESASIPDLDYGQVVIATLKAYKSVSLPFASGVNSPELTIEIFNPIKLPFVIVDDGQNENIISKNSVIKSMPYTTSNPIIIKERNGDSDTIIIIKVGYSTGKWETYTDNILFNKDLNVYVFSFPANADKLNYTYALLETSGTNANDNVKYCYATNIGSAILPSSENCYRVSKDNSYTIKVINPLLMYKEYEVSDELKYYVSIKPTSKSDTMNFKVTLVKYETNERNFEGIGNSIQISTEGKKSTILTSPEDKDEYISVQIQSCDNSKLSFSIYNGYDTDKQIVSETEIPANKKNYYIKFKNIFLETELKLTGNNGNNVFVKHSGVLNTYSPSIKDSYELTFDEKLNQLIVENPLKTSERMRYKVFVGKKGSLSSKGLTLCSFAELKETIAEYNQTYISFSDKTTVNVNFNKIGLKKGDEFEAIAFIEQEPNSQMAFLTKVFSGYVGEIKTETINEISTIYESDSDYVYLHKTVTSDDLTFYFSFLPSVFDVPVGAFRIQLDSDSTGDFSKVSCAFVDDGEDATSMVEAVEQVISSYNSYCIGGKSKTNSKNYNYMVRYSYTKENKPRRLVIKLSNNNVNGGFTFYVRKGDNIHLGTSDFNEQVEYGKQEEYKKSIIPYIVDLEKIRGNSTDDYVSKVLIYSQHLEMQMYYLDSAEERHDPILLFTGNIMLVYTKPALALQKYHSTKLVLLSENINGQEHSSLGNTFRFHTKMFRSTDQIEYFVSNNPTGRTINYPLSIEMNTCTSTNNKYYYILNYNKAESEILLYLDLVFGSLKSARVANEINAEKWDILLENSMTNIYDYQFTLSEKSQHIDIIEFECNTPLLINIYYNNKDQVYSGVRQGDIVVKNLAANEAFSFTTGSLSGKFYYSIETFCTNGNPDITIIYDSTTKQQIQENSINTGFLMKSPYNIYISNNGYSSTRIIYKIGYGVESEWNDEKENIEGKLYSKENKYVYKFPIGDNKKNFTDVVLDIKAIRKDTQEESENVKFCYSTSIGMPIDTSQENCYRTGATIPYSLTFINPLISSKNYKSYSDNYYVTISPFSNNEYISLSITENKYKVKERNIEGIGNKVQLSSNTESTILSVSESTTNNDIVIQLQACNAQSGQIKYSNKNIYTGDVIYSGIIEESDKRYYYIINNNLMETELELNGVNNDLVFVKHTGINNYPINLQSYGSSFDKEENTVYITKPIKDEAFSITVLVGKRRTLENYSLCTFAERKENDFSGLADYVKTFTSVSSNTITHFIDFRSFNYKEGDEFELLVYAVQMENSKLEILYNVINGIVGKIKGITEISEMIDSDNVKGVFTQNKTSNYLFYDFKRDPVGDVASLKIINPENGMKVNKIGCVFVKKGTEDVDMVSEVNRAILDGTNVCVGQTEKDTNGFDALISARDVKNGYVRLVMQVLYGIGEAQNNGKIKEEGEEITIQIRINGYKVDAPNQYNENEQLTLIPYVLDLTEIRGKEEDYISKVMVYSSTREMQMFYLGNGAPTELFSGNIMLVYTNPEVIKEKYNGATTMILLTDSLSNSATPVFGEQFRFKAYFLKSDNTMQYYVSANPSGRLLNNPTSLEMPSCDVPYYYILNYHFPEGGRTLHIDNIFGEIDKIKIATELNKNDWYDLVEKMEEFTGNEYNIGEQIKYHMDVIEVTCKIPTLINIYYTDKENPKVSNLDQGDISIIDLGPTEIQTLQFKQGLLGEFIYSFNVFEDKENPNIQITFEDGEEMNIDRNGIVTKNSNKNYEYIKIENKQISGNIKTKVIFKFGYNIDSTFTKIENNIYNLQTEGRPANLFAYKFNIGEDRLNTTSIDFKVSTRSDNVKFCYITNLGAFIDPSLQNCYRVGKSNSYTISVLNPYLMYKNYYIGEKGDDILDYYVTFQTVDISLNITITPTLNNYTIETRNIENVGNTISFKNNKANGTILTSPKNKEYLFVQMGGCTKEAGFSFEFKNAYDFSSLNHKGEINSNNKYYYINVENTKLDTFLNLTTTAKTAEIFVKHTGIDIKYQPIIEDINISFDNKKKLSFTQPIKNEEFKYTIYIDKQGNLIDKYYNLCQLNDMNKLAHYSTSIVSDKELVELNLDFENKALKGYENFDLFILAEGTTNGKLMILSDVYQSYSKDDDSSSNTILVIILVVLAILLVAGGIIAFIFLRKYKQKPDREKLDAKETSLADVDNKNEKMITSTASQANE